jgi:hypothetical protein
MTALRGSCLCGGVRFEIAGPLMRSSHCHCRQCQKGHGAPFRTRARVAAADFRFLAGEELVSFYESTPGTVRGTRVKRFVEGQDRAQLMLLPECLDDFVGEDNPVRVIDAFIERVGFGGIGFCRRRAGGDRPPLVSPRDPAQDLPLRLFEPGSVEPAAGTRKRAAIWR